MEENKGGSLVVWIITIILMVFSASRSVHLVQTTLPQGDGQIMGFAALAALDGGVLGWFIFCTRGAAPGRQRVIGYIMLIVDLVGVVAALLGDTWLVAGQDAKLVGMVALWLLPIIIGLNVIGAYTAHLMDPSQALRDAEHQMQHELEKQRAEHIKANAGQISQAVSKVQAEQYMAEMLARFEGASGGGGGSGIKEMLERIMSTRNNGNGKVTMAEDGAQVPKVKRSRR